MNFNLGDTVLCINDHNHLTLQKGTLYTIQEILACKNCQEAVVDVGLKLEKRCQSHYCRKCNTYATTPPSYKNFAFADRFVKLNDLLADVRWKKEMTYNDKLLALFNKNQDMLFPIESGEN